MFVSTTAGAYPNFIYPPKKDGLSIENVEALKNDYEGKERAMREKIKQLESDKAMSLKKQKLLALKNKELTDQQRKQKDKQRKQKKRARKKAMDQHKDYQLTVDNTVKIINHIGRMPEELPALYTEGHDDEVGFAFDSIVPIDWKLYMHKDLNPGRKVSWNTNGDNWIAALYGLGINNDYMYDVNWDDQWVLVNESKLRRSFSTSAAPTIIIKNLEVKPGEEGHIIIDGKIMRVRAARRN